MTILITVENPERSGAPRMALQYARALVAARHRVIAACGPPSEGASSILGELDEAGVEVWRLPSFTARSAAQALRVLRRVIRKERVSCVVGFQQRDRVLAALAAGLTRARCVIAAGGLHVFHGGPFERQVKRLVYGWTLRRRVDLVICASEAVERELQDSFGIGGRRAVVVPNGIDIRAFPSVAPKEARRVRTELGLSHGDRLLLNVGRIHPLKGQDLLLRAWSAIAERHPDTRLALVGASGGSSAAAGEGHRYGEALRSMVRAARLGGRVSFLGWRDDIPRLLAAADLFVHPSFSEGWPVAVLEAMAARRPIVASDCVGRPKGFVDGVHGWIVPTGDVAALGAVLDEALSTSRSRLREMGARGRDLAERHYDIRFLGSRFVELVERVAAS